MIDISNKHETQEVETEGLSLGRIISLLSCCYIPFLLIVLISMKTILEDGLNKKFYKNWFNIHIL